MKNPESIADYGIDDVVDHYAAIIADLPVSLLAGLLASGLSGDGQGRSRFPRRIRCDGAPR